MEIHEEDEEYFLVGNISIKIYLNDRVNWSAVSKDEGLYYELEMLKKNVKGEVFSINEAMLIVGHSNLRKTQRLLKKGIEQGELNKSGKGKNTKYSFEAKEM
jgi:hypothetical protein